MWTGRGSVLWLQRDPTAEQRALQEEHKERDMLDALWTLKTLVADFGLDEVHTHVLQHLTPSQGHTQAPTSAQKGAVYG